jgi:hypothetical protein
MASQINVEQNFERQGKLRHRNARPGKRQRLLINQVDSFEELGKGHSIVYCQQTDKIMSYEPARA